jgi:hypothetical protein
MAMRLRLTILTVGALSLSLALGAQTMTMEKGDKPQPSQPKSKQNKKQKLLPPDPPYIEPIFHEPIEWFSESVTADLDCDGSPDTFTYGSQDVTRYYYYDNAQHAQKAKEIAIRVELTGKHAQARKGDIDYIPFRKTTGYYGFCSGPKNIKPERLSCEWEGGKLPGCDAKRKCEALRITDECSEFLVFWNWDLDRLSFVRPSPKLSSK